MAMTASTKKHAVIGLAFILSVVIAAGILLGLADLQLEQKADVAPPDPPVPSAAIISRNLAPWLPLYPQVAEQKAYRWARSRAQAKLQTVMVVPREPLAFGPWTAAWDPDLEEGPPDGSLAEWDVDYYITHNWSSYGVDILDMQPGDTVTVNDVTIEVEGIFDYPKQSILDEVIALVGDATVLQTCVPGVDYNRIVYGWPTT